MGFWIRGGIWALSLEGRTKKGNFTRVGTGGEIRGSRGGADGEKGAGESEEGTDQAYGAGMGLGHEESNAVRLRTDKAEALNPIAEMP